MGPNPGQEESSNLRAKGVGKPKLIYCMPAPTDALPFKCEAAT
jgi:hypothetical protein